MGSAEISDDDALLEGFKSSIEPLTFGEQLDEWCYYYMSIGVPYDVFWYGDYCCLKYYESTYRLTKRMKNEMLWLQGMYNYEAFGTTISRAFDKRSKAEYSKKPYEIVEKTEREKKLEIEEKQKRVIRNLNRLAEEWSKNHAKDSRTDNRDNEQRKQGEDKP